MGGDDGEGGEGSEGGEKGERGEGIKISRKVVRLTDDSSPT